MIIFCPKHNHKPFPPPEDTTYTDEVWIGSRSSRISTIVANIDGTIYLYFHEAPQALNKVLRDVYTSKLSARLNELEKDQEKHAIKLIRAANATTKSPLNIPKSVSVYELKRVQETFAKYDALYKSKQTVTSYSKTQVKNALKAYAEEKSKQEVDAQHTLEKTKKQLLVKLKQYKGLSTAKNDDSLWKREGIYHIDEQERCNLLKSAFDLPQENKPKKPMLENWMRNIVKHCADYYETHYLKATDKAVVRIAETCASIANGAKKPITAEGILRSAGYDSNGNVKPIKQYGLTRAEGPKTLSNNVAALRKCFYIINMAAVQRNISIASHPIHVLDGIHQSLKGLSVVGNGKEEIDLGISNKDKKEFAQQMVRWVKDQHVINDFETLQQALLARGITFDQEKERKTQRTNSIDKIKKDMLTLTFWYPLYPLARMRNRIAGKNIGSSMDALIQTLVTNTNSEIYTKFYCCTIAQAKIVAGTKKESKSNKNPMVYGLPDVSKLELLFAFTSHVQTHAPATAFARLAVTLWQSYMFKETSVRGATCMVIRLQSLADYNQWTNLCKHYIEPNLGIDCIVYSNDKVQVKKLESKDILQRMPPVSQVYGDANKDFIKTYFREEHPVFFQFFDMAKKAYEILTGNDTITATSTERREYISGYQHGGGYKQIKLNVFPHTDMPTYAQESPWYMYAESEMGQHSTFELSPIERGNLFKKVPAKGGNKTKQRLKAMLTRTEKVVSGSVKTTKLAYCTAPPVAMQTLTTRHVNDSSFGSHLQKKHANLLRQIMQESTITMTRSEWCINNDVEITFDVHALIGTPRVFGGMWTKAHLDSLRITTAYQSHPESLGRYMSGQDALACEKFDAEFNILSHEKTLAYNTMRVANQEKSNGHTKHIMEKHYDIYTDDELKKCSRFGNDKATIIDRGSALPYWVPSRNIDGLELVYTGERTPMPAITPIEEKWGHVNTLTLQQECAIKTMIKRFVCEIVARKDHGIKNWRADLKDGHGVHTALANHFNDVEHIQEKMLQEWIRKHPKEFQTRFGIAERIVHWWRTCCCFHRKRKRDDDSTDARKKARPE